MGLLSEVAHEGEAFIGHKHTEQIFHFGMKSKKLNKKEGNFSRALAGASGKVSVGDSTRGAALEGNAVVGRVGMGYSVDYTFPIPKYSLKIGANIAEFAAKANAEKQGMEYKVLSADIAAPSVSASASVGGNTVLPTATFEAHTLDPSVSVGGIELGVGNGANMSASYGMDAIKPDKGTIKELRENGSKMQGAMNSPREERPKKVLGLFRKADAEKSSLGNSSANLSGVGSVERDSSGEVTVENGLGIDTYTNGKAFVKAIFGTNGLYRTTGLYRNKLLENAENQHNKNIERLQKNDGRDGFFIRRSYKAVADKSSGYVDKLNGVINQAALRKQSIDRKLENATPGTRKADRLTAQSQKWGNTIDKYTDIRDKISADKDRANANLERVSHTHSSEVAPKSTDQIVADAMKHVQDFQGAIRHKGIGASGEEAINVGGSKIELNQRNDEIDRKLNENNKDLQNIIRRRETLEPNDPERARLNDEEKRIRNENKAWRAEKGECQKAYNETDKNFSPRESSENFEQRDRTLQAERIDNENAKAAVDGDIAIYCNEYGIDKDTNGNYPQDPGLQNLLDTRNVLEKRGNEIQNDIDQNKKDWAKSENLGRHSIKVELDENNGEILVKQEGDDYGARVQDNEDLRDNNSGDSNNQQNQNEQNRQPSEDNNNNNVQQSQSGQEDQQHQPSEGSNNEQNSQSQQSSEIGNNGHNQSEQSGQSQQLVGDSNDQLGQSEQGNQSSRPLEGNNTQQSSSEQNSQSQQPAENNNVQQSQSGQSSQSQQPVENNNNVQQSQSSESSQSQQPAGNSHNQQGQSEQENQPFQPSEGNNNTQQSTSEQNSQPQQPVENNNNVQQSQSGESSQPQQPVENNNVQQSQSGGSSQPQQPAGNSHNQQGQNEQGNQPLQPSEGNNNTQQSTSEQNSQSQQPVENNNNVQQSQSGESSQPQQPVENNNNVQQRQSGGSSQPQQPAGNSHNQQGQSEQGNQPLQPSEGNSTQQSQSGQSSQSRSTSDENANQNASTIHDSERHFQPTQGQSSAQEPEGSLGMPARAVNANQIASGECRQNSSAEMPTRAVGQNRTQDQGASAGMPTRAVGQNGTQEQGASAGMPTRAARQNETQEQGASAGMPTRAAGQNGTQEQGASVGMPTRAAEQSGSTSSASSGQSHSSGQSM